MEEINFEDFLRVQIRTGTILEATLNTKARNPAYILRIDFGPLGIKTSSAHRAGALIHLPSRKFVF